MGPSERQGSGPNMSHQIIGPSERLGFQMDNSNSTGAMGLRQELMNTLSDASTTWDATSRVHPLLFLPQQSATPSPLVPRKDSNSYRNPLDGSSIASTSSCKKFPQDSSSSSASEIVITPSQLATMLTPMGRPPPHVHSHPPRPIKSSTPIPQTPPLANSTTYAGTSMNSSVNGVKEFSNRSNSWTNSARIFQPSAQHAINPSANSFNQSNLSTFNPLANSSIHSHSSSNNPNENDELTGGKRLAPVNENESTGEQLNEEIEQVKSSGGKMVQPDEINDGNSNQNGNIEETGSPDSNIHNGNENLDVNRENSTTNGVNSTQNRKNSTTNGVNSTQNREMSYQSSQKTVNNTFSTGKHLTTDVMNTSSSLKHNTNDDKDIKHTNVNDEDINSDTINKSKHALPNNINKYTESNSRRQLSSSQSRATPDLVGVHRSSIKTGDAKLRTDENVVEGRDFVRNENEGKSDRNVRTNEESRGENDGNVLKNEEVRGNFCTNVRKNEEIRGNYYRTSENNSSRGNISSEEELLSTTPELNSSSDMETMESGGSIVAASNSKLPYNINERGNNNVFSPNIQHFSQNMKNSDNINGNECEQDPILETEIDTFHTRTIDRQVSRQNIDNAPKQIDMNRNNVEKIDESGKINAGNRNTTIDSSIFLDNRSQWSTLDYSGSISNNDLEESTSLTVDSQCEDPGSNTVPTHPSSKQRLYQEMCTEL
ncbi:hypothetical protein WDU94_000418 [Cyamophila willieti]